MLLCIDASYLLFYRINALKTWHKHRSKEDADDDVMLSDEFKQKLCKMLHTCIVKLCKTYRPTQILFAYDGHLNWRKVYDTQYKATRNHQEAVLKLFQYGVSYLKELDILCCPTYHIECDSLEADDLIHYVVRKRNTKQHLLTIMPTTILANDYDYLPLLEYTSTVHIVNLKNKTLTLPEHMNGEQYLLMKIILGDKSDNISSILKRCGPKTATKIALDKSLFNEKITNGNADVQKKYHHIHNYIF